MDRIALKVEVPLPSSQVFKAIARVASMAELTPGLQPHESEPRQGRARSLQGTVIEFTTKKDEPLSAKITEVVPNVSFAFEDERGVRSRWVCVPVPRGTLIMNEILGHFGPDKAAKLESEAFERLNEFVARHLQRK